MKQLLTALVTGILFGLGLGYSQMIDRGRVLGFLDISGQWDPALLFVLGGAVIVTLIAFRWVLRQPRPLFAARFELPTRTQIDRPLILGAALFGIGWGIAGYCPGPAVAALAVDWRNPLLFLAAMSAGSWLHGWQASRAQRPAPIKAATISLPATSTNEAATTPQLIPAPVSIASGGCG